ncbi:hypothetical protein SAMN05192553_102643 [Cyclobacterium xiamenense]|uniref:Asparagine synthase n=1 Tax=Cyclobacterium xiamenense TaxID=1297121 RepID=A0A1H6WIV3_9BACT|nr:hypothetical protein [Cyclobacterium xiamenense]SEJ15144.1 hypothetical protein SAMN05192553_102643 [Cyclobacterium xiamenense]
MFLNQFLLTRSHSFKEKWNQLNWKKESIGNEDFTLFCHPTINLVKNSTGNPSLYLIGSLYDWEFPELTDQEIIDELSKGSASTLFESVSKYTGEFIIIFYSDESLIIFNDATGQREIYYDLSFDNVASQVSLLAQGMELIPHDNKHAIEFYNSDVFKKRKLLLGDSTQVKNVKHLNCNHFIDLKSGKVTRFYPNKNLPERSMNDAGRKAATMIKGYLKAISNRHHKIAMAVTGGYDSRILFLASLEIPEEKCTYYVFKRLNMSDNHHDIILSGKLTRAYGKKRVVLDASKIPKMKDVLAVKKSLDFPPNDVFEDAFKGQVYINGNVFEIARSVFGYAKNVTAEDLTFLTGYRKLKFPTLVYKEWLKSTCGFKKIGYDFMDFLYWEDRMGIWLSKGRTQQLALNKIIKSPYNSRQLIEILLSVNKKYRGLHHNALQKTIIAIMSENNRQVTKLPINPTPLTKFYTLLFKMNLYNTFRHVGLKLRLLGEF